MKKKDEKFDTGRLEGHSLKTRRDFLSLGLISGGAYFLAPSSLQAAVQGCAQKPAYAGLTPVLIFDLVGGSNIAGSNVIVGGAGGQADILVPTAYSKLGLPASMTPDKAGQVNTELGLHFHSDSGILRGIKSVTTGQMRASVDGMIFCSRSNDDTNNNEHNPLFWLNKAGAQGRIIQNIGTNAGISGGNSRPPLDSIVASASPSRVRGPTDNVNLVSLGQLSATNNGFFGSNQIAKAERVLRTIAGLSERKVESLSRRDLSSQLKKFIACGIDETENQFREYTPQDVDPLLDDKLKSVIPANLMTQGSFEGKLAATCKLLLDHYVGVGTIEIGGCDYHTGNRSAGEAKDLEIGRGIGYAIAMAAAKGEDLVIYVFSDGGVGAGGPIDDSMGGRGKISWTGDSGDRSSTFMIVYKHNGRPSIRRDNNNSPRRQIGFFKPDGNVSANALLTSNSRPNTAKAMVANYLALHGLEHTLASVVKDDPFKLNLDHYLAFEKMK